MYLFDKFRGRIDDYVDRMEEEPGTEVLKDFSKDYVSGFARTYKENTGLGNLSLIALEFPLINSIFAAHEYSQGNPEAAAGWLALGGGTYSIMSLIDYDTKDAAEKVRKEINETRREYK